MRKKSQPMGLVILICDTLIEDKKTKKKSLIGLFNSLKAISFPVCHPEIHVFVGLTAGNGKYNCQLNCINESNGKVIAETEGPIEFISPNDVIELDFCFHNLIFPEEGNYSFEFLCEAEMIFHRRFIVRKQGRKTNGSS
jgi:hypothetical protein